MHDLLHLAPRTTNANQFCSDAANSLQFYSTILSQAARTAMTLDKSSQYIVQSATEADIPQIHDIYSYYVANTTIALMLSQPNEDYIATRWRSTIERKLPYLIAARGTNNNSRDSPPLDPPRRVLGYCHVSPLSPEKAGYRHSVELTLYIHHDHLSLGIGYALLLAVLEQLKSTPYISWEAGQGDKKEKQDEVQVRKVYAVMSTDVAGRNGWIAKGEKTKDWYITKFGFREAGRLVGVAEKFGQR